MKGHFTEGRAYSEFHEMKFRWVALLPYPPYRFGSRVKSEYRAPEQVYGPQIKRNILPNAKGVNHRILGRVLANEWPPAVF
jgi:hypothetical protein